MLGQALANFTKWEDAFKSVVTITERPPQGSFPAIRFSMSDKYEKSALRF
jgi:hypothetical protein